MDAARCHARCQPFFPYTDGACCLYVCSKVPVPLKQGANTAEGEHLPIQTRQAPDRPTVDVPAGRSTKKRLLRKPTHKAVEKSQ